MRLNVGPVKSTGLLKLSLQLLLSTSNCDKKPELFARARFCRCLDWQASNIRAHDQRLNRNDLENMTEIYSNNTKFRQRFVALLRLASLHLFLVSIPLTTSVDAATSLDDAKAQAILQSIWRYQFEAALDSSRQLIVEEDSNAVGYFLMGLVYYSIANQYRSDRDVDSITHYLDVAIKLAQHELKTNEPTPESYYVLGSSYGCRALFRSIHGGWWGAFRDGHHSCSNLEKALALDSSLTDAFSGIGAYHYWKSAKSKKIAFLPFISDQRKVGLAEIYRAIEANGVMEPNARKALLPIYNYEKRYDETLALADTLAVDGFFDSNSQLHAIRALIELTHWSAADSALDVVAGAWALSEYADSCGSSELLFLRAQIRVGQGKLAEAKELVQNINSAKRDCEKNEYFHDTLGKAKALKLK
ncbi:MAG: hypothetical protein WBP42_07900 [Candidatus Zixiibacteriota bacterium]